MANVLQEFLVKIAYQTDVASQRGFFEQLTRTAGAVAKLASGIELAAGLMAKAFVSMGQGLEKTYYIASQSGMSVKGLDAFAFAASRLGSSSEEAYGAIKQLGGQLQSLPALRKTIESQLGIAGLGHDMDTIVTVDMPRFFQRMKAAGANETAIAEQYSKLWQIPVDVMRAMMSPEFTNRIAEAKNAIGFGGRDTENLKGWQRFLDQIGLLELRWNSIKMNIGGKLADNGFNKVLEDLGNWADKHGDQIATAITNIAKAIGEIAIWIGKKVIDLDAWLGSDPEGWTKALTILAGVITVLLVPGLTLLLTRLTALGALVLPGWLLPLITGAAALEAGKAIEGAFPGLKDAPLSVEPQQNLMGRAATATLGAYSWYRENFTVDNAKRFLGFGAGQQGANPELPKKGWWTPERIKFATDYLVQKGGFTEYGAAGAVGRMMLEAPQGPGSVNPKSGAFGISQVLGARQIGILGNTDFVAQLEHYRREHTPGTPEYKRAGSQTAAMMFRTADNPTAGAIAASMTERAENYDPRTGTDILTWRTPVAKVHDLVFGDKAKEAATAKVARTPALSDPLMATLSRIPTEGVVAQPNTMDRTIGGDTSNDNSRSMEINQNVKIDVMAPPIRRPRPTL
jgi:hypothetical protein